MESQHSMYGVYGIQCSRIYRSLTEKILENVYKYVCMCAQLLLSTKSNGLLVLLVLDPPAGYQLELIAN